MDQCLPVSFIIQHAVRPCVRACVVRCFPRIFGEVNLYTAIPFTKLSIYIDSLRSSTQRLSFTKLSIFIDSLTPRTQ